MALIPAVLRIVIYCTRPLAALVSAGKDTVLLVLLVDRAINYKAMRVGTGSKEGCIMCRPLLWSQCAMPELLPNKLMFEPRRTP